MSRYRVLASESAFERLLPVPQRGIPHRVFVIGSLLALVVTFAGGCGKETPKPKPVGPKPAAAISVAVYGAPEVTTAYAELAAEFTAKHPETTVQVQPYPSEQAAVEANAKKRATGNGPDLFMADVAQLDQLMRAKAIQPVDRPLVERDVDFGDSYQRSALEAFSKDTSLQCMPVDVSPMVVYYNRALINLDRPLPDDIAAINPAKGWSIDQFRAALQGMLTPKSKAMGMTPSLEQLAPFIWSGGGELVDSQEDPTALTLASGASVDSLEDLLTIVRDPTLNLTPAQLQRKSALQRFLNGRLGVLFGYRDLVPQLRAQANLDFDVMPVPKVVRSATVTRLSGMCISGETKHFERAADFLTFAVSDEAATKLAATGYVVPSNTKVLASDGFLQPALRPVNAQVFSGALKGGRLMPRSEQWPEVETAVAPLLAALFTDPVIDPLADRLKVIDDAAAPILNPKAIQQSASPSGTPTAVAR